MTRVFLLLFFSCISSAIQADDWPHFLGPNHNGHSAETGLDWDFEREDFKPVWTYGKGKGHAGPVVVDDHVVFIHQKDKNEEIVCLKAENGSKIWKHSYGVEVGQNFGIVDAPRSSPVIDPDTKTVYTLGNDGDLLALELESGKVLWQLKVGEKFGDAPTFFGIGSCPLLLGDLLIIHVGSDDTFAVALNKTNGEVVWKNQHEWHGSYASPIPGKINGEDRILIYAGGKTKPPAGGLVCLNPKDGKIDSSFPWRTSNPTSVVASSPVVCDNNQVFISEDYGKSGVMIQFDSNFKQRLAWTTEHLGCQFQTPIFHDGMLTGFGGTGGLMVSYDTQFERLHMDETFIKLTIPYNDRELAVNMGRGSLIWADGDYVVLGENGTLLRLAIALRQKPVVLSKAVPFYAPETWAPPVLSNGRLYLVQNEMGSKVICYDVRKK